MRFSLEIETQLSDNNSDELLSGPLGFWDFPLATVAMTSSPDLGEMGEVVSSLND
jgi:hypothetical protein